MLSTIERLFVKIPWVIACHFSFTYFLESINNGGFALKNSSFQPIIDETPVDFAKNMLKNYICNTCAVLIFSINTVVVFKVWLVAVAFWRNSGWLNFSEYILFTFTAQQNNTRVTFADEYLEWTGNVRDWWSIPANLHALRWGFLVVEEGVQSSTRIESIPHVRKDLSFAKNGGSVVRI